MDGILSKSIGKRDIKEVMNDLPTIIGMKILAGPIIVEGAPENPGWTGIAVIEKSHIAIHTFEEGRKASFDIYSCETFEKDLVIDYLKNQVQFRKVNTRMLIRSEE
jgi:S-adenosylmethionine/arginine decarboxylase-like enzyme